MKRRGELDALRILACFFVVMIHVTSRGWDDAVGLRWYAHSLLHSLSCCAVPLFVMITGAVFLSRPTLSLRKLYGTYILRLIAVYFAASAFYAWVSPDVGGGFWAATLAGSKAHLWYLPRIIGTYALLPLLWCAAKWEDGKYVPYLCAACFVCVTLKDTASALALPQALQSQLRQMEFPLNSFAPYILLGWLISKRKTQPKWLWGVFVLLVLGKTLLNRYIRFDSNSNAAVYALAVCLFACFSGLRIPAGRALRFVSDCTLGIYLIHIFILEHIHTPSLLLDALIVFALSLAIAAIYRFVLALFRKKCYSKARKG